MSNNKTATAAPKATAAPATAAPATAAPECPTAKQDILQDFEAIGKMSKDELVAALATKLGETNAEKLSAFADKLIAAAKSKAGSIGDALSALQGTGLKVQVSVSEETLKSLGVVHSKSSWDWKKLAKWAGGGIAVVLVTYGSYRLYISYSKGKAAKAAAASNGTVML